MDFWKAITVLLRRWYVALPALLLTFTAAYGIYSTIPTQYSSTALMVLTVPTSGSYRPPNPTDPNPLVNPLLNFDGGLNMTASILVQILNGPEVAGQIGVRPDSTTTYKVNNGHPNPELLISAPFVVIEGTSRSPQDAKAIVQRVAERAKIELKRRQQLLNAPQETFINLNEMVAPTEPAAERGGKTRTAAAVFALGVMAALGSSFAAESIMTGLRQRRREAPPQDSETPSEEAVLQR
ncbi:hypothetical protein [Nonomuraea solani]|uniref:hypothetical protein n=1 Tax=Nonomuraea solani TaxID=1144553 RepID=UPI0011B0C07B|nr:hypothetical protein [Nonomuraea solani]